MRGSRLFIFILLCCILSASAFIEEAVKKAELEYSDSEEELFPGRQSRTTSQAVIQTKVLQRSVHDTHKFTVSESVEFFVKFEVPEDMIEIYEQNPQRHIFQVNAESANAEERYPVDITIKQFRRMITFQLPTIERRGEQLIYSSNERSVDFCPIEDIDANSTVTVSISTESRVPVDVMIRVLIKGRNSDWKKSEDQNGLAYLSKTTIKPVISRIRYFDTKLLNTDSIIVKVATRNDTDCLCSVISIQHPTCPFYDDIGSAMRFGKWSTMMDQGTVIIDPEEYPNGFILVLVASAHGDICGTNRCEGQQNITDPRKRISISIGSNGSDSDYAKATMAVISLYIGIFILTISFSILEFRYKYSDFEQILEYKDTIVERLKQIELPNIEMPDFGQVKEGFSIVDGLKQADDNIGFISEAVGTPTKESLKEVEKLTSNDVLLIGDESQNQVLLRKNDKIGELINPLNRNSFEFIDKSGVYDETLRPVEGGPMIASVEDIKDINSEVDTEEMKVNRRTKKHLYVSDLSTKLNDPTKTKSVYQKSQLYLGVLFLVSIYYSLPVLQMVFRFSAEQRMTGNQDICYYNDLCRKPLGHVRDFNHVFSNLGYCVFGLLFMCIVLFKKLKYESFLAENANIDKEDYGVPTQYGLYFAMGLSLFMEGVMSSSYHVCPTNVTFQFDTTFMYLLAVLMFMKLYQTSQQMLSVSSLDLVLPYSLKVFLFTTAGLGFGLSSVQFT
eukprot:GFUD01009743.1.p1 GENE.GFUD01009743.1~~GFUD01009743.1.p1  ORF type:complete len:730 (+),score=141.45 GFUD01009743.1:101-2290(+)